jgi:hypothetical protein
MSTMSIGSGQSLEKRGAVNAIAREAWIDADHLVAACKKIGVRRPPLLIRRADHRDGFHGRENIAQKKSVPFVIRLFGHEPALISGAVNSINANFIDPRGLSEMM